MDSFASDVSEPTDEEIQDLLSEEAQGVDPDAPYGRFANGKPRKSPMGKYSDTTVKPPTRRKAPGGRPSEKAAKSKGPDYEGMAKGLIQIPAAVLFMLAHSRKSEVLLADAGALTLHADDLAKGIGEVASQDARIANAIEKIAAIGPYAAVLTPALAMVCQIGTNHGRVPVGTFGTVAPASLVEMMENRIPDPPREGVNVHGAAG